MRSSDAKKPKPADDTKECLLSNLLYMLTIAACPLVSLSSPNSLLLAVPKRRYGGLSRTIRAHIVDFDRCADVPFAAWASSDSCRRALARQDGDGVSALVAVGVVFAHCGSWC